MSTDTISPRRAKIASLTAAFFLLLVFSGWTLESPSPRPSAEAISNHARYLASDDLTGRGIDTPGIMPARDYIAREFAQYGLIAGGDNGTYFQSFEVATGVAVKQPALLAIDGGSPLRLDEAWRPLGLSGSGKAKAEVIFAGYGITAKDYGYDDYAGINAEGKIVLVLRYEPPPASEKSPFRKSFPHSVHAALRTKATNARDHGAVGMILVDLNDAGDEEKELLSTTNTLWRNNTHLLAAQVKRRIVEDSVKRRGISLAELKEKIDREEKPASRPLGMEIALTVTLEEIRRRTDNVIGVLPGADPAAGKENVVIGAHYDHLGLGYFGTADLRNAGRIHPGADDNASGTAVLLAVASDLSNSSPKPARTIIFVAFSAEELGLHGSRRYVQGPAAPLSATKAMLNLDMVGRLRENRVTVFGTRSARELSGIVTEEARRLGLEITEADGVGRSDHMSFYNKQIPSLHFFTGTHSDYHRPSDTWDKLNAAGMARVAELVAATAKRIAGTKQPLVFSSLPGRSSSEPEASRGYGAYLGTIPDFSRQAEGVRLAGATDGSPAAAAGIREGDIIVQFAGRAIQNLEDLTTLLRSKKPGDDVEIVVLRGGQTITLRATVRARS
jgi:hypothetical protein